MFGWSYCVDDGFNVVNFLFIDVFNLVFYLVDVGEYVYDFGYWVYVMYLMYEIEEVIEIEFFFVCYEFGCSCLRLFLIESFFGLFDKGEYVIYIEDV